LVWTKTFVKASGTDVLCFAQRHSADGGIDVIYIGGAAGYSEQEARAVLDWAGANGAWVFLEGQTKMCMSGNCVSVSFNDVGANHGINGLGYVTCREHSLRYSAARTFDI
jgi:hypothetical protein